jgi:hypothetical protein
MCKHSAILLNHEQQLSFQAGEQNLAFGFPFQAGEKDLKEELKIKDLKEELKIRDLKF